jgi:hypothetical protein
MSGYVFPFGSIVTPVVQTDRSPKKFFVLGVYASAVHAKWFDAQGRLLVQALAVASEPEIFWRGDGAAEIIAGIDVPENCGYLAPAESHLNGPSGQTLDEFYLQPLGLTRADVWLCDLLPETRLNQQQQAAIERRYQPLADSGRLPAVTVPPVPKRFADDRRRKAILEEILESEAEILITLGDIPISDFVAHFDPRRGKLCDFVKTLDGYGGYHSISLDGRGIQLLPLIHPHQAGGLGHSSSKWKELHKAWAVPGNLN